MKTKIALALIVCTAVLVQSAGWYNPVKTEIAKRELNNGKVYLTFRSGVEYVLRWPLGHEPPNSVKIWQETYCCSNGVVVLEETKGIK